jgi:hypothetical protein
MWLAYSGWIIKKFLKMIQAAGGFLLCVSQIS